MIFVKVMMCPYSVFPKFWSYYNIALYAEEKMKNVGWQETWTCDCYLKYWHTKPCLKVTCVNREEHCPVIYERRKHFENDQNLLWIVFRKLKLMVFILFLKKKPSLVWNHIRTQLAGSCVCMKKGSLCCECCWHL